jgi:hypothetical protein
MHIDYNLLSLYKMIKMRSLLTLFFAAICLTTFSQKKIVWFDLGLKVQNGSRGLYSKAVADDAKINHELGLTTGLGFGAKLGVNFEYSGLSLEGFYNKGKQVFENNNTGASPFNYEWNSIDIYPLFRNAKNLGYFEIGPKVSLLGKMNKVTGANSVDVTGDFNKLSYAGVLGFGANILGNDGAFSGILGLRFEYGFSDIVKSGISSHPIPNPATRTATNPYFAGVVFELNWGVGYFGVAKCGARSKFIMF